MNNWKKITLVIVIVLCLGLIAEVSSYIWQSNRLIKQGYKFENNQKRPPYPTKITSFSTNYLKLKEEKRIINKTEGKDYKAPSIIAFGDVFVNSYDNKDNTFAHKLSEATKRPVYNMGEAGWGISQMYFLLKNEKELDNINPETIIFLYHTDMKNRLTSFSFYPHHKYLNLKYKLKNGKLVEDKPIFSPLYKSYLVRNIERFIGWRKSTSARAKIQQENCNLIQALFTESKEIAQEKYPNLKKFIIIRQPADWETLENLNKYSKYKKVAKIEYDMWKKLQDNGFIVLDLSELTDIDLTKTENFSNDSSIKPEVMDTFMPVLVEKTDLVIKKPVKKKQKFVKKAKKKPVVKKNIIIQIRPEIFPTAEQKKEYNAKTLEKKNFKTKIKEFFNRLFKHKNKNN